MVISGPFTSDVTGDQHRQHRLEGTWPNVPGTPRNLQAAVSPRRARPPRPVACRVGGRRPRRRAPPSGVLRPGLVSSAASNAAPHACGCSAGARGDVVRPGEVGPRPFVVAGQRVQPRASPARRAPRNRPGRSPRCGRRTARARRAAGPQYCVRPWSAARWASNAVWPKRRPHVRAAGACDPAVEDRDGVGAGIGSVVDRQAGPSCTRPTMPCPPVSALAVMPGHPGGTGAALLPQQRHRRHQTAARFVEFGLLVHVRGDGMMPLGLDEVAPPHREYGLHPPQLGPQHRELKLLAACDAGRAVGVQRRRRRRGSSPPSC